MPWIESHQSLANHRKTLHVMAILNVDRHKLIGHLHELWWWGLDNADLTGYIGTVPPRAIAQAAGWPTRDAERFVGALVSARFVERGEDGSYMLHDWFDYAGKLNEQRARNRARMAAARDRRTSGAHAGHVSGTSGARAPATGPDQPDLTGPDLSPPAPPYGANAHVSNTNGPSIPPRPRPRQCPACASLAPPGYPAEQPFCHESESAGRG